MTLKFSLTLWWWLTLERWCINLCWTLLKGIERNNCPGVSSLSALLGPERWPLIGCLILAQNFSLFSINHDWSPRWRDDIFRPGWSLKSETLLQCPFISSCLFWCETLNCVQYTATGAPAKIEFGAFSRKIGHLIAIELFSSESSKYVSKKTEAQV